MEDYVKLHQQKYQQRVAAEDQSKQLTEDELLARRLQEEEEHLHDRDPPNEHIHVPPNEHIAVNEECDNLRPALPTGYSERLIDDTPTNVMFREARRNEMGRQGGFQNFDREEPAASSYVQMHVCVFVCAVKCTCVCLCVL